MPGNCSESSTDWASCRVSGVGQIGIPISARDADLKCNCCDCRELSKFLQNPNEHVHRFPLRKDRRQHLHRQIETHHCDLTHVTERTGSPQTLVCTKTQGSYERRVQHFEVDSRMLLELEEISERETGSHGESG